MLEICLVSYLLVIIMTNKNDNRNIHNDNTEVIYVFVCIYI